MKVSQYIYKMTRTVPRQIAKILKETGQLYGELTVNKTTFIRYYRNDTIKIRIVLEDKSDCLLDPDDDLVWSLNKD